MKGQDGEIEEVDTIVNLPEQKTSHIPNKEWHIVYTPDRIAIEPVMALLLKNYNPGSSYEGHTWETKWSNLQLAYFFQDTLELF